MNAREKVRVLAGAAFWTLTIAIALQLLALVSLQAGGVPVLKACIGLQTGVGLVYIVTCRMPRWRVAIWIAYGWIVYATVAPSLAPR